MRSWTNGNLHAYVEPTAAGYRLRLGTVKGNGVAVGRLGISALLTALVVPAMLLATGEAGDAIIMGTLFATMGAAALGANALRLPRWADQREEQMEHIAARARTLIQ